jgi:Fe(3+) dicitrate transport protein
MVRLAIVIVCLLSSMDLASAQPGSLRLTAKDPSGATVPVQGQLSARGGTLVVRVSTAPGGIAVIENLEPGSYQLNVAGSGFEPAQVDVTVLPGQESATEISLKLAQVGSSVVVRVLPGSLDGVPGATALVTRNDLDLLRPLSVKEALRRVTGVHIVDEDAFGLNLNVGLRGLNPRRTQRTLLLEDGVPIHLAPYGDPSAHYHTPPELLESVEVLKGSGQIAHGPQTVGGMINFVTQPPPDRRRGTVAFQGGNRDYKSFLGKFGTGGERGGILGHLLYRDGAGTRIGHAHQILHGGLSGLLRWKGNQSLQLRGSYYEENSKFAEGGVSQAAFEGNPLGNPFAQDRFYLTRLSLQALYGVQLGEATRLAANFYYQNLDRASYRQADFAGDEMTANAATGCTGPARVNYDRFAPLCGNKMRPRSYDFFGIDPRLEWRGTLFGMRNETSAGLRYHTEDVSRRRYNGLTPDARETSAGVLFRDWNTIRTHAAATYAQSRFFAGKWSFTPGVRLEHVRSTNQVLRRGNVERNAALRATQTMALPGFGATYGGVARSTIFAGVHRGFAPPRPDDNFDPLDPNARPVDAERSTNYELGIRTYPFRWLQIEATAFRIDFTNQIVAGASVGQPQFTWANAGKTLHAGLELASRFDFSSWLPAGHSIFTNASYTRVGSARFNSDLVTGGINVRGNRLPYAPANTFSPSIHYQHRTGFSVSFSPEYVGRQFSDNLNRLNASADGLSGPVPSYAVFNAAVNVPLGARRPVVFLNLSNLGDRRFIASRVDGIQVGRPRQVFAGLRWDF